MKKKIILGIGSMLMATTAAVSVVSCNGNKDTPVVTPTGGDDNGGSPTADAKTTPLENAKNIIDVVKKDLADKPKEALAQTIVNFVNGGISKISGDDLKEILKTFGVTGDIPNILGGVLDAKALDIVLNTGFGGIAKATDKETKVGAIIDKILPDPSAATNKIQKIFTKELITKLLVGFKDKNDFTTNLNKILGGLLDSTLLNSINSSIKFSSLSSLPLFKNGLLRITSIDFLNSLKIIAPMLTIAFGVGSVALPVGVQKVLDAFSGYKKSNSAAVDKSIENISNALITLLQTGIKSLKTNSTSYKELVNLIEIFLGKKDLTTLTNKTKTINDFLIEDISSTTIGKIVNEAVNNIDKILKFLNDGLSKPDWKTTFNNFFDSLKNILDVLGISLPLGVSKLSLQLIFEKMRTN